MRNFVCLSLIIWCIIVLSVLVESTLSSETRRFRWEVEYMYWAPDCIQGIMMGINGQFPGPTIRARVGDTIQVKLTNKLYTEGVVIHWHGIRQFGTPWADGTASISQCPINPGETFTYRFKVDRAGTYFYHGHYGMQRSLGLYGMLIVDMPQGATEPFHYDGEFSLLLSDWWHKSVQEQGIGLSSIPFRWIDEPQSILINGRGQYICSLAAHFSNSTNPRCRFRGGEQCAHKVLKVHPNKTYRLRIASSTALSSLNLAIGDHKMIVVEADGNYVQPFTVDDLDIYSGETYSTIITTDKNPNRNYWITVGVRGRHPKTAPALTTLNYKPLAATELPPLPPPETPQWNDFDRSKAFSNKILATVESPKPPRVSNRRIILLNSQNRVNGFVKWAMNNISRVLPPTPYLGSIRFGLKGAFDWTNPPDDFPANYNISEPPSNPNSTIGTQVYMLDFNSTVDVILQNANMLAPNVSEIHPWHLHGHDFWVLGYGEGRFMPGDEERFNLENPPLRNSVVLYPHGWTALRFVADNPGAWSFHCHIEPHMHMGMGVVFAEGVDLVREVPVNALTCGLTARMLLKKKSMIG